MAIYVKTERPSELVKKIRDGIENHTIETWLCDSAGDFTHDTDQWRYHAWMTPYIEEERVVFGIICRKDRNLSIAEDGRYRVDNNAAESIMRDLACGRKNFLFCGSDNAAKNLAFAYSLTESCKLNNINPYDYWSDLIAFVGCEGIDQNIFLFTSSGISRPRLHKYSKKQFYFNFFTIS